MGHGVPLKYQSCEIYSSLAAVNDSHVLGENLTVKVPSSHGILTDSKRHISLSPWSLLQNYRISYNILQLITISDWWFGICFIFPYIGNFIIPTDELIFFQSGRSTTNQIYIIYNIVYYIAAKAAKGQDCRLHIICGLISPPIGLCTGRGLRVYRESSGLMAAARPSRLVLHVTWKMATLPLAGDVLQLAMEAMARLLMIYRLFLLSIDIPGRPFVLKKSITN